MYSIYYTSKHCFLQVKNYIKIEGNFTEGSIFFTRNRAVIRRCEFVCQRQIWDLLVNTAKNKHSKQSFNPSGVFVCRIYINRKSGLPRLRKGSGKPEDEVPAL